MVGAIGGMGTIGGGAVGAGGGVGAVSAGGGGSGGAGGGAGAVSAPTAGAEPSAKVFISDAAKAASTEAPLAGASFSVSKDASGHQYVGGTDSNGFSNMSAKPMEIVGTGGGRPATNSHPLGDLNANGQSLRELNVMSDLVAALLLALMLKHKD